MFNPPHPGAILKELYIEPLKLTLRDVSEALGIARQTLSYLINSKSRINSVMAVRLSRGFPNTSPEYWLNLQQQYDLWFAKQSIDLSKIKVLKSA
jgi:addiction module HigA family antidote